MDHQSQQPNAPEPTTPTATAQPAEDVQPAQPVEGAQPPQAAAIGQTSKVMQASENMQPAQTATATAQPAQATATPQPAQTATAQPAHFGSFAFATGQHYKVHHSYIWLNSFMAVGAAVVIGLLSSIDSLVTLAVQVGLGLIVWVALGLLFALVFYGIVVGVSALSYRHLSFVFDQTEFSLYSGILTKRRVHVPYARVQSVNHRQSLVQRLAGVCTVEVDTAGGASNKAVKVPYVKLDVGEAIRRDLFVRKAGILAAQATASGQLQPATSSAAPTPGVATPAPGAVSSTTVGVPSAPATTDGIPNATATPIPGAASIPSAALTPTAMQPNVLDEAAYGLGVDDFRGLYGGAFAGMEPASFERRLNNKELMLASVSHSSMTASLVTALALFAGFMAFFGVNARELLPIAALMWPLAIAVFVLMLGISFASTVLSFGGFCVRRRGSRIEVERGILQRDFSGIDIDRIQSVVVRQSFVRRLLGFCEVSVGRVRAGGGEDQSTQASLNAAGLVIHPFLRIDQVDGLINGLLPEFADRPVSSDFRGLPAIAMRRALIRRCIIQNSLFWITPFVVASQIAFNVYRTNAALALSPEITSAVNGTCIVYYVIFALSLALSALGAVWWKRGSGYAMNRSYLAICNDGLSTETVYLPRQKVQDVMVRTNPFQRAKSLTTIAALTAAGVRGTYTALWDVPEDEGQSWLDWLKPRTSVVE